MKEVVVTIRAIRHAKLQSNWHHQHPTFLQTRCSSCRPTNRVRISLPNMMTCKLVVKYPTWWGLQPGMTMLTNILWSSRIVPALNAHTRLLKLSGNWCWFLSAAASSRRILLPLNTGSLPTVHTGLRCVIHCWIPYYSLMQTEIHDWKWAYSSIILLKTKLIIKIKIFCLIAKWLILHLLGHLSVAYTTMLQSQDANYTWVCIIFKTLQYAMWASGKMQVASCESVSGYFASWSASQHVIGQIFLDRLAVYPAWPHSGSWSFLNRNNFTCISAYTTCV